MFVDDRKLNNLLPIKMLNKKSEFTAQYTTHLPPPPPLLQVWSNFYRMKLNTQQNFPLKMLLKLSNLDNFQSDTAFSSDKIY